MTAFDYLLAFLLRFTFLVAFIIFVFILITGPLIMMGFVE
jgi:hypothetical protein